MECCSSTSSSDYREFENVCAILAAETFRRKVWVHDINMKRKEKGEFHHLAKELEEHPNRYEMYFRMTKEEFNFFYIIL
jgi:spore coat polysaccharide biosynthesis protein SpsF (cytidylyltransferase family)